ncbi:MAG TPA: hypothetical protein VJY35_05785 [Candidatus Eisenbacteria bacterium]|nr:hypothetical protein [Candidatus Eisenbacteria bacterium]
MLARISPRVCVFASLPVVMLAAGCAGPIDPPTRPAATETAAGLVTAQGGFFPLATGNRWIYRTLTRTTLVPLDGSEPTFTNLVFDLDWEVLCSEASYGTSYQVMRVLDMGPNGSVLTWVRYRQTAGGLFHNNTDFSAPACASPVEPGARAAAVSRGDAIEALVAARPSGEQAAWRDAIARLDQRIARMESLAGGLPPGFPQPGGALPWESTELRYPLEPKARWAIRSDFPVTLAAEVEGFEALNLPAGRFSGYRIRIINGFLGANDHYRLWYGRAGFLRSVAHLETDAVDIGGHVIGKALFDQHLRAMDIALRDPRSIGPRPWEPGPPPR